MPMTSNTMHLEPKQSLRGFGLVELMVGMVVALITSVVIFQVLATADQSRRVTTAGANVQAAGGMAMYFLERDLQQAGLGLGRITTALADCAVGTEDSTLGRTTNFFLRPVSIVDGGASASDQLTAVIGNSGVATGAMQYAGSGTGTLILPSRAGFIENDVIATLRTPGGVGACALAQVARLSTNPLDVYRVDLRTSGARFTPTSAFTLGAAGEVFNLGARPRVVTYRIDAATSALIADDVLGASAVPLEIAPGVVDLQAQYGYDADGSNRIEDSEWTASIPVGGDWSRVLAVRVAILARASEYSKDPLPGALPTWGGSALLAFRPAANADAAHYRYRAYESTITVRNVLWGQ
jgi:type IV pilus assembly protein PilW